MGVEILRPTASDNPDGVFGGGAYSNPANAYDNNLATLSGASESVVGAQGGSTQSASDSCRWKTWQTKSAPSYTALVLKVNLALTADSAAAAPGGSASGHASVDYSTDGGSTWTNISGASGPSTTVTQQTFTVTLSASQDLTLLRVRSTLSVSAHGGTLDDSSADASASVYEIWTEGTPPAPTCTNCSPGAGTTAGGTSVTLTGTNFYGSPTVTFGGVAATSVVVVSTTSITCVTPAGSGLVNVVVTNPDGQTGTLTNGYQYQINASTTASSLSSATSVHAPGVSIANNVTGVSMTSSVGTVFTPEAVVGVSMTGSMGSVGGSVNTPVTGKSSTTSVGSVIVAVGPNVTGISSTTSVGAPTYTGTATFNLTGLRITSTMGVPAAAGISQAIIGYFQVG